jgi:nucleoside-diphosphate kinase
VQVDKKNHKTFLKRTRYDELRGDLFFVGSEVTVFSRKLKIVGYGDDFTRRHVEGLTQK